jgi:hypothetical protein
MREARRVRFLAAIWGARYVSEFCRAALPSFLAPGNLPHLAAETELEVLIMTSAASLPAFDTEPCFARLRAICPVRFILIDDLIGPGLYGVTLTLAYARGIRESGAAQTETDFFFMNSDFVLSDGALTTVLTRLRGGHRCVLAPSLRARAEAVLPLIERPGEAVLALPPRAMVGLALAHLHPTVIGKTVSQDFVTSTTHNQIYWQVDGQTLLARHFLIFMVAIRPEVPLGPVASYCDYGFVPALVPSGGMMVLGDSDEFFMMELQATDQEKQFLRPGRASVGQIAQGLMGWTTAEHRRVAGFEIVFRAGALPQDFDAARARFAAFMGQLGRHLTLPPLDHRNHPYWLGGVAVWRFLRGRAGGSPPELASTSGEAAGGKGARRRLMGLHQRLLSFGRRLRGKHPHVPIWHPGWPDAALARAALAPPTPPPPALAAPPDSGRNLLICGAGSPLVGLAEALGSAAERFDLTALMRGRVTAAPGSCDHIVIHLTHPLLPGTPGMMSAAGALLRPGGTISLFLLGPDDAPLAHDLGAELAAAPERILPGDWLGWQVEARFTGGLARRILTRMEQALFRQAAAARQRNLPLALLAVGLWPAVAACLAIQNRRSQRPRDATPRFCTSALIRLRRPAPDAAAAPPAH